MTSFVTSSSPPSAPGGQSWAVGGQGSHATAPPPAAPPCRTRSDTSELPQEKKRTTRTQGPTSRARGAQPPGFTVLHRLTAPNTTKLSRHRESAGGRRGPRRLCWPLSATSTGNTRGHPGPLRPAASARGRGSQHSAAGAACVQRPGGAETTRAGSPGGRRPFHDHTGALPAEQ